MYRYYKVLDTKEVSRMQMDGEDQGLLETFDKKVGNGRPIGIKQECLLVKLILMQSVKKKLCD